jgi:hypothetical protein
VVPMPPAPPAVEAEPPMGRTYSLVVLCHIAVIAILWWFGRAFSV